MCLRAIYRVPVELWRIILFDVIYTPLLPFVDANRATLCTGVVECMYLFDTSCDFYDQYRKHQLFVKRLRLICRQWNVSLQDLCNVCSVTNLEEVIGPIRSIESLSQAQRVQIDGASPSRCTCLVNESKKKPEMKKKKNCFLLKTFSLNSSRGGQWLPNEISEAMVHSRVKILSLHLRKKNSDQLLKAAPNIRALSLDVGPYLHWTSVLEETFRRLTHLSLTPVDYDTVKKFPPDMKLNNIHYLSLHLWLINKPSQESESAHSIRNWAFPRLKSLLLTGYIDSSFSTDTREFLGRCGRSVTELVFSLQNWDPMDPFSTSIDTQTIWDMFPLLQLYGATLSSLVHRPNLSALAWNQVVKVVLSETWIQLRRRLTDGEDTPARAVSGSVYEAHILLLAISTAHIAICDKSGVSFSPEETWSDIYPPLLHA
ncbi:hypothetical protein CPB86DRAFT_783505 [Serendipita vermifera]|nr:hypothetical protein CPB86DRAFT_783505 [Serendipita vermifera]